MHTAFDLGVGCGYAPLIELKRHIFGDCTSGRRHSAETVLGSVSMNMSDALFTSESVVVDLNAGSQKQLFQDIALRLIEAHSLKISCRDIVSAAIERERLGSTGVGNGVALPHARIDGLNHVVAGFARLTEPMDFDSVDGRPVDLIAFLLAPSDAAGAHLRALARVSRQLRREDKRSKLRAAPDAMSVFTILSDETTTSAAA